jgi:hypothetical protein
VIKPERKLIEVGLKMLGADAVMDAVQPRLQVREDEMANRQEFLGHLWIAAFGNRVMIIPPLAQAGISAPVIGDDQSAGYDGSLDKSNHSARSSRSQSLENELFTSPPHDI